MKRGAEEAERFRKFLSACGGKRLAIASHSKMDVDGLASAYALSQLLPGSKILVSEKMGAGARLLAARLKAEPEDMAKADRKRFDAMVVVDTSTFTLIPEAKKWNVLAIIDHHQAEGRDMEAPHMFIDRDSPSTAEIVERLLPSDKVGPDAAWALAAAIISDGARFKSARMESFAALARLMEKSGADYRELLDVAEPEPDGEAKIAMLKACQRVQFVYAGGCLIATSEVGSNESDAAALLVEAADVAFVANWKDREQESRVSARAGKSVHVPLNEVMRQAAAELGGAGGGHKKASGAYIKAHTAEALERCVQVFVSLAEKSGKSPG